MMTLQNPWALLLIPLAAAFLFWAGRRRVEPGIRFPHTALLGGLREGIRVKLWRMMGYARLAALIFIILAVARPQGGPGEATAGAEGIDIILAIDVSTSMLAADSAGPAASRIAAARELCGNFIRERPGDRIGMVAFAARPYTVCPLTLDHGWLARNLERVDVGLIEDGTAIGSAILASLNRLKGRDGREGIVILLTDGRNNAGETSPLTAAAAARVLNTRVYTIGIGSRGSAVYPVSDPLGGTIRRPVGAVVDEAALQRIASETGAAYFRAADGAALKAVFGEVDRIEKRLSREKRRSAPAELYPWFLIPAMAMLLVAFGAASGAFFRRAP
jgi:Ca-activated chloride channel family protein